MFFNASKTDREGSQISMVGNLGHYVDNDEEVRTYNKAGLPKAFDGNITLFKSNMPQYFKRFHKSACCDNPENLLGWLNFKTVNNEKVREEGGVTICKECGYIVDSSIEQAPELPAQIDFEEELEEPEQDGLDSYLNDLINIVENE